MSIAFAVSLYVGLFSGPTISPTRAERYATYIVRINQKARPYAVELTDAIFVESRRRNLDPFLFGAICWTESYFQLRAPGRSGERGPWQLMRGLQLLNPAWYRLRVWTQGLAGYPELDWDELDDETKSTALRDPVLSTYLAAYVLDYLRERCNYPTTAVCYARYNRPASPRLGYVRALIRRAAHIRRAVDADIP